eukprot:snap_masked-scaffold_7-processed-gene-8.40-mRNA-1 protein AED:1.00 eAED:1.00 QI:0/0/0/0/1/1/2/0/147
MDDIVELYYGFSLLVMYYPYLTWEITFALACHNIKYFWSSLTNLYFEKYFGSSFSFFVPAEECELMMDSYVFPKKKGSNFPSMFVVAANLEFMLFLSLLRTIRILESTSKLRNISSDLSGLILLLILAPKVTSLPLFSSFLTLFLSK